jgi:hypothetical protein
MMAMERKNIRSEGIRLDKKIYWHRELVNHVGQSCIIRYDYSDARWIVVYDKNDVFICQAALRKTQHPFIEVSMDKAVSHKELNKEYKEINGLRREKERSTKRWVVNSSKAVDLILKPASAVISTQNPELEDKRKTSIFASPPMLEAPPKDSDEIIEEMTRRAMQNMPLHHSMLSNEEREKLNAEEKERLAQHEINRIIEQEIKATFDMIGLDYRDLGNDTPIEMQMAFSKTAREYYNSAKTVLAGQAETTDNPVSIPVSDTSEPTTEQTENNEPKEDDNPTTEDSLADNYSFKKMLKTIGIN